MFLVIKRLVDILLVVNVLLLIWPLFILISSLIKIDSKGPIFFKQKRIGKGKKIFLIYKFRSMRIDAPKNTPTHLLKNSDIFITKIGKSLRRTSLDELPQLFNILKGEMSIIGPRPALWNQYDLIEERDKYGANNILPGLTGWAQINGRDELPIRKKAALDGEYVAKMSSLFDLKIFFLTFSKIIIRKGIVEGACVSYKNIKLISNDKVYVDNRVAGEMKEQKYTPTSTTFSN